jgi:hypothetical protein
VGPTTFLLLLFSQLFQRIRNLLFYTHCEKKIFGSYEHILQSLKPIALQRNEKTKCKCVLEFNSASIKVYGLFTFSKKFKFVVPYWPRGSPAINDDILCSLLMSLRHLALLTHLVFYFIPGKANSKKRSSCLVWLYFLVPCAPPCPMALDLIGPRKKKKTGFDDIS